MKQKGLVMTRHGNFITVVPITEAASIDPLLIDVTGGKIKKGDVIVTQVFRLKYIDAESTKNLLTSMGLGVEINTSASAVGILIVTEYAYRMSRVEEIINMVDKPGEPKKFRFRPLKYIMAAALKSKIEALAEQLGTVSITIASQPGQPAAQPQLRRPVPRPPPTPTAAPATEAQTVYIDVDERTNRLLMIGRDEQLDIVESLIDILDVGQQDLRSLRLYGIQNADAQDVVAKLEQLGIITAARTGTTTRPFTAVRDRITPTGQPAPGAQPSSTQEFTAEEPQVIVIESTNSLLVNATAEQHLRIATIIGYVDSEPEQASTNYAVYPLENQDPEEMAKVLNQLIEQTVENKDPTGKVVGTTVTKKTEEAITIIPDKNTFSIIAYASKKNQQWIESLIKQLDKRRPQVLIDVTLVEVKKNDEFNLDLSMVSKFPRLEPGASMEKLTALLQPTTGFPSQPVIESTVTGGSGKAFYADNHIQALLTAMDKKGYGRILAKPKLLVNDNETGTIATQVQTAIVSPLVTVIPGPAGSSATSALSVSTQTYTSQIKLEIKPHISEGNLLRLEVTMNRTDFEKKEDYDLTVGKDSSMKGPTPPDLLSSDVTTVITVPDDRTIILGGLEKLNQTKGGTKVPILGDLPLVGGLFRSTLNMDTQNRLYVFVKANILRPEEKGVESDIVRISDRNRKEFEKHEKQMQDYEDWPGIKPTPMDPKKIFNPNEK
jgi:type II secretory pathway component GspD/PulD (secretin)